MTTTSNIMDNDNQQSHRHMIALYYCYPPPNGLPSSLVESHATFHRETCVQLNLNGRIRVCTEGINGVLSGLEDNLRLYEILVRCELTRLCRLPIIGTDDVDQCAKQNDEGEAEDPTAEWFHVKYCQLRNDIPTEKQLFDSLSVKITKEVVSLIDEPVIAIFESGTKSNSTKKDKEARQRRSMRRRAEQEMNRRIMNTTLSTSSFLNEDEIATLLIVNNGDTVENSEGKTTTTTTLLEFDTKMHNKKFHHDNKTNNSNDDNNTSSSSLTATPTIQQNENVEDVALPPLLKDWAQTPPAIHLSPSEWNDKLLALSTALSSSHVSSNSISNIGSGKTNGITDIIGDNDTFRNINEGGLGHNNNNNNTNNVILLDARNMYETRIGHFAIPNISTLLPNTRKFANLPSVLNTKEAASVLSDKDVYMYCTGGVRCERASSYLRALSESNTGAWANVTPPKTIYQLHGGIQSYLEIYGTFEQQQYDKDGVDDKGLLESCCSNEVEVTPTKDTTTSFDLIVEKMNVDSNEGDRAIPSSASAEQIHLPKKSKKNSSCLYRGKNFVFDQRRTDPIIGNGIIITTNTNEDGTSTVIVDTNAKTSKEECQQISQVRRCIVCSSLHDDFDNGFAPCDNKEARCCRCRVLILVCNACRANVRCWGEQSSEEEQNSVGVDGGSNNDSCGITPKNVDVYCGNSGMVCVDDGNVVGSIKVARY